VEVVGAGMSSSHSLSLSKISCKIYLPLAAAAIYLALNFLNFSEKLNPKEDSLKFIEFSSRIVSNPYFY